MLRRPELRLLLRSIADHRLRRGAGAPIYDGHIYLDHRARLPRAPRLVRRAALALRRDGARLYVIAARPHSACRRHRGGGSATRASTFGALLEVAGGTGALSPHAPGCAARPARSP